MRLMSVSPRAFACAGQLADSDTRTLLLPGGEMERAARKCLVALKIGWYSHLAYEWGHSKLTKLSTATLES